MTSKRITVICHEAQTYEVHLDLAGDPPVRAIGGASLNLEHLKTELRQHGCSDEQVGQLLGELEDKRTATTSV